MSVQLPCTRYQQVSIVSAGLQLDQSCRSLRCIGLGFVERLAQVFFDGAQSL